MERQREDLRERKPYYASSVPAVPVHQVEPRKNTDFNGKGHPSWVSLTHPSLPLSQIYHFIDSLKCTVPCRRGAFVSMNSKFAILAFGVKCAGRNGSFFPPPVDGALHSAPVQNGIHILLRSGDRSQAVGVH